MNTVNEPVTFGQFQQESVRVTIFPGESKLVYTKENFGANSTLAILGLGTTQHPNSTYTYIADGLVQTGELPVGTVFNPFMFVRDIGREFHVQDSFKVIVKNNDAKPHYYANLVMYRQVRPDESNALSRLNMRVGRVGG